MKSRELFLPRRLMCVCLLGAATMVILVSLMAMARMLQVPAQLDYGEGHVLWMSQQITNGELAYKPIDRLPYVVFPYTPLYLLASRAVNVVSGNLLVAGRSLSLASTIGIVFVVALTVFWCLPVRFPRIWRLASASFAASLTLCMESVAGWGSLMRVDMLALFLMFAGLAVYITLGKREQWQYVSAFLFVLAIFTKQTMLSAPLACAFFGLLTNPKATIRVCGFSIILGLSALFLCNSLTHGGFWKNVVDYNLNPFSWQTAFWRIYTHLQACIPPLVVGIAALLSFWNMRAVRLFGWKRFLQMRSGRIYDRAIIICGMNFLLAGIWTLSIGKMGSSYNFFLAWDISACLLCGFSLFRFIATWRAGSRHHETVSLAMVLLCSLMLLPSQNVVEKLMHRPDAGVEAQTRLIRLLRASSGPVLSENLFLLTQAGKEMQIEPATLSFLVKAGRWDERPYLQLVNQKYFQLIVTSDLQGNERYTPVMASAIKKAYSLDQTIGKYSIYRPFP